jgi:uncharacterized protein with von Willebrand factor type A (vWA) domain
MGGTSFDNALKEAFEIISNERWMKTDVVMITDGMDTIRDVDSVMDAKQNHTKLIGIFTNSKFQHLQSLFDVIFLAKKKEIQATLEQVGNSIL